MGIRRHFQRALLFASLLTGGIACAQVIPEELLARYENLVRDYNVVTLGNLNLNGVHTDGGIAVGGNLTLGNNTVLVRDNIVSSNPTVYVNGQITLNSNAQLNHGFVSAPNISSTAWSYNPPNQQRGIKINGRTLSYNTSHPSSFENPKDVSGPAGWNWTDVRAEALSISAGLAGLSPNGTITVNSQSLTFVSSGSTVTVFTLDANRLGNGFYDVNNDGIFQESERIANLKINIGADEYFVINVVNATSADGSKKLFQNLNINEGSNSDHLLWNILPDANGNTPDILNLASNLYGSILAPDIDMMRSGSGNYLYGQLLVGSYTQQNAGEIHYNGGFNGPVFSPVPEPSTYALIACSLCAVGIVIRRRWQARQAARPPEESARL